MTVAELHQFLSTPSARRATTFATSSPSQERHFYPRPPRGGRLCAGLRDGGYEGISIHALREEGDCECIVDIDSTTEFLSTPSARRATAEIEASKLRPDISIHALREEGDGTLQQGF